MNTNVLHRGDDIKVINGHIIPEYLRGRPAIASDMGPVDGGVPVHKDIAGRPVKITFFNNTAENTVPGRTVEVKWREFAEYFREPTYGFKDGSYYVRGKCVVRRCNTNMSDVRVAVIDADKNCIGIEHGISILEQMNFQYIIHTIWSISHLWNKRRDMGICHINHCVRYHWFGVKVLSKT